jgi:hypothetical protein
MEPGSSNQSGAQDETMLKSHQAKGWMSFNYFMLRAKLQKVNKG